MRQSPSHDLVYQHANMRKGLGRMNSIFSEIRDASKEIIMGLTGLCSRVVLPLCLLLRTAVVGAIVEINGTALFTYDDAGRLLTMTKGAEMPVSWTKQCALTYNNDPLPVSITYADGTTAYEYDNDGLVVKRGPFDADRDPDNDLPTLIREGTVFSVTHQHRTLCDCRKWLFWAYY